MYVCASRRESVRMYVSVRERRKRERYWVRYDIYVTRGQERQW